MIQQMAWTRRRFEHEWPVELLPGIVERLRGTPARAAALVAEFTDAEVRRGRGAWSALEHIGHLDDLHALDMARLDEYLARAPLLTAADMANRTTYDAHHNERPAVEVLERFRARRLELVERLEVLTPEEAAITSEHPRLRRPFRLVDWLYFLAEHDDHHLAKAREALRA
jgi:DinB superfamily